MKTIIVTGGSGYIGTGLISTLIKRGYHVINIDIKSSVFDMIFNEHLMDAYTFIQCDLRITKDVNDAINSIINSIPEYYCEALIHMAAFKDLCESYNHPLKYYDNNIACTVSACKIAHETGCRTIVFSSSSAVYDDGITGAVAEYEPLTGSSPYGYTKVVGERIVMDYATKNNLNAWCLRYCNPVGCCEGTKPDTSDSMFGNLLKCFETGDTFTIFGGDYDTKDGTPIRDYIDLQDLVDAHIFCIEYKGVACDCYNVGTGKGVSCKEVCELASERLDIKYVIGDRRAGDAAGSWADITKLTKLGWKPKVELEETLINIYNYYLNSRSVIS